MWARGVLALPPPVCCAAPGQRYGLLDSSLKALAGRESLATELAAWGIDVQLGEHIPGQFEGAAFVVPSLVCPWQSLMALWIRRFRKCWQKWNWRYLDDEPVLAITGTSGKTTTASLAAAMLHEQGYAVFLGGNIGTPLSEYVLGGKKADVLVLEISSFQLQACTTFCPRAVFCLISHPITLITTRTWLNTPRPKFRLFRCQDEDDLAVFGEELRTGVAGHSIKAHRFLCRPQTALPIAA